MSQQTIPVTVQLIGGEYRFSCAPAEQEELLEAGEYLNEKMREIRDRSSKLLSLEAITVITAMNLSHELLRQQRQLVEADAIMNRYAQDMTQKIEAILNKFCTD